MTKPARRAREPEPAPRPARRRQEPQRGSATVTRRHRGQVVSEDVHDEPETLVDVPEIHGRVGVGGGSTVNLGDYNSVQVRVWVEIPCAPDDASLNRTRKRASKMVEAWIQDELDLAVPE